MKRGLIVIFLFLVSFGSIFAQYEDCIEQEKIPMWTDKTEYICVTYNEIPEWKNKEDMYEYVIKPIIKGGPSSYYNKGSIFIWRTEYEEAIRYYIENYVEIEEEKRIMTELLFLENFWSVLHTYVKVMHFDWEVNEVEKVFNKAIEDLNKYGKDNVNYDYYLGRYSFFFGMLYYYDKDYKKALEYIKIVHDKYKIEFKIPEGFSVNNKFSNYAKTIDIKIGNEIINTDFYYHYFTNQIKDFGNGWEKYNGYYITKVAIIN